MTFEIHIFSSETESIYIKQSTFVFRSNKKFALKLSVFVIFSAYVFLLMQMRALWLLTFSHLNLNFKHQIKVLLITP